MKQIFDFENEISGTDNATDFEGVACTVLIVVALIGILTLVVANIF